MEGHGVMSEHPGASGSAKTALWSTFARAIGAELRSDTVIRGSSGLEHEVQAIAVDEKTDRVVIVSAEASPRMAALMQVDVQASMPGSRVLVARPVALDLVQIARKVVEPLGLSEIDIGRGRAWISELQARQGAGQDAVTELAPEMDGALVGALNPFSSIGMPAMPQILGLIMQAERLPWSDIGKLFSETAATGTLDLRSLMATDNLAADLAAGVCPVPLYELSETDVDMFISGTRLDDARQRLVELGIYQYFFPSPDQLALGLVDEGINRIARVAEVTGIAPQLGHPFGAAELMPTTTDMIETVAQLKALGYVADGEHGIEISESGRVVRSTLKFRPREGLLTKLINRISLSASVSPGDFLK